MSSPDDSRSSVVPDSGAGLSLHFQAVRVERFNGVRHDLAVDLQDDITVVYGANASGKTTLARAIRALLWPASIDNQSPLVSGQFRLDGANWRIELEGESWTWLEDQQPASRPPLPPASHASRYHLYLQDLLRGEGAHDFAELVLREAQGGIDVEGAAEALGFEVPTRRASKTSRAVEETRADLRAARQDQEALREDEKRLDALRKKRADAQTQAERASALEQAIEVARARTAYEEAQERLDAFPDVLDVVRGDEVDRLETLQAQIDTAAEDCEAAEATIEESEQTLSDSRIPEEGLPDGRLEALRTAATTLKDQERAVRDGRAELEAAREREEAAWEKLAAGGERGSAAEIDLPQVQAVEEHVQAVEALQGRRTALSTAKDLFAGAEPEAPSETLREALRHLHRWLQARSPASSGGAVEAALLVGCGGLVVGGGVWLAVTGDGILLALGLAFVLLGVVVISVESRRRIGANHRGADQRSLHQDEFERLGLEAPEEWSPEGVEQHTDQLLAQLREAAVAEEKQAAWQRLRPERDEVKARAEELSTERQRLADQMGLDPDVSSRALSWLVDRLAQWQSAHEEWKGAKRALETAEEEAEACRERLTTLLAPYELGPVEDASDADGAVEALQADWDTVRDAQRRKAQAEEKKASAEDDRADALAQRAKLYERLNLEPGAEAEFRALVQQHEDYESAVEAARTARSTLEAERRRLERCEGFEEWMATATEADLVQERRDALAEAERQDEYLDEIKEIEHAIEAARDGGTVEQLQATYRQTRDQLAQAREEDYERAVGQVLTEMVQEETRDQGLPAVFHRAKDLFADVTNDRYELQLDRGSTAFRAYDHVHDRPFALEALSSGTQVQLLLCVRVAFVEAQEHGVKAPLVLDETLANSDAERARALIEAVQMIARQGRQVLYMTAQTDEVQKWASMLGDDAVLDHAIVSLSELDERSHSEFSHAVSVPARSTPPDLPDPEATTHETLHEALDVPRWTPRQPVKRLHLWYLIEALGPLLDLVEAGTRTWGQLQFQYQRGGLAASPLTPELYAQIQARARAVASWKEAWQVGRGRPVNRPVLEQTDAVTETYIDGVSALAEELDGDAEALLQVIRARSDERVSGFRTAKADELESFLREHNFLDPRDRHTPAEMWQYVLADLSTARQNGIVDLEDLEHLFGRLEGETPHRKG